jgi:hypothetical protein
MSLQKEALLAMKVALARATRQNAESDFIILVSVLFDLKSRIITGERNKCLGCDAAAEVCFTLLTKYCT